MGYTKMGSVLAILGVMFLSGFSMANGANVHHYSFILKETNFTKLCESKSALTVNGSFPGPTITVRKGDTAFVNVHNNGEYGVTIHWHGVKQPRNPWSDGPENVTQCPIAAGTNMTYEVIFSHEEGTLWWHAHSDWTRATVHGAIIILPALGTTYPFATPDAQETLILASWFKGDVMEIIEEALASGADPNISNAFTINGQPGDLYDCSSATTYRWMVDYGKTYLLRVINAVMNEEQFFSIANHTLTVVAQDAAYLKPITTSLIMITPGQTMDILVTANKSPSHYYIASTSYVDGNVNYNNSTTTAILQYKGNYSAPSTPSFPTLPDHNDTTAADNFTSQIRALASNEHPVSVPLNISSKIFIAIAINERICPNASCSGPNNNALSASLNNISFVTPNSSILQAYYGGGNNGGVYTTNFPDNPPRPYNYTGDSDNTTYPSFGTKARMIKYGEGVEIVFQGTNIIAPENHPMHLHGFSFYLVGTGSGNYNNTTSPTTYNLVDPPEVNTIGVPRNGWAAIRFLADNPGVWFMHCHLERHTSWGMDNVFIVRNGNTTTTSIRAPPAYMPPCPKS